MDPFLSLHLCGGVGGYVKQEVLSQRLMSLDPELPAEHSKLICHRIEAKVERVESCDSGRGHRKARAAILCAAILRGDDGGDS